MLDRAAARAIGILVGIALLLGLIAFGIHQWQVGRAAKARDRASTNQAQAGANIAHEALNTAGNVSAAADADRKTSQEAQDAINRAEAGNSNGAADAAVCSLRAYRDTERCRELRAVHP